MRKERFREAIEAFETAHRLSPHYAVFYNISQSYLRLGELEQAVLYLEKYLEEGGVRIPEPQRAEREQQLAALKLERDRGTSRVPPTDSVPLTVQCDLPGVQAWLDGTHQTEDFPATFLLPKGGHTLEFRRRGYATDTRELTLTRDLSVSCAETVVLTSGTTEQRRVDPLPLSSEPRTEATLAAPPPSRAAAYATAATGLVLVGVSAGILVWNRQRQEDWEQTDDELAEFRACAPDCSPPVPEDFNSRQAANNDLSDSIERFEIVALSTGVAGLALVGVGAYLATKRGEVRPPSTELSLAAGVVRVTHTW